MNWKVAVFAFIAAFSFILLCLWIVGYLGDPDR